MPKSLIRTIEDFRIMPWKNGQGSTTELAVAPEGADLDQFEWRISSAPISVNAPFSSFRGVDRSLLVMSGAGVVLHVNQQVSFTLTPSSAPLRFAGEDEMTSSLIDGAIQDFNVMTRRNQWTHTLEVAHYHGEASIQAQGEWLMIYLAMGRQMVCVDNEASYILLRNELLISQAKSLQLTAPTPLTAYIVHLHRNGA